jgi:hypothetical protein
MSIHLLANQSIKKIIIMKKQSKNCPWASKMRKQASLQLIGMTAFFTIVILSTILINQ